MVRAKASLRGLRTAYLPKILGSRAAPPNAPTMPLFGHAQVPLGSRSLTTCLKIAKENLRNDTSGKLNAVRLIAFRVCLLSDEEASTIVRDRHFPSTGKVPSDPVDRPVLAGSDRAAVRARDRITSPLESQELNLREFGSGLHAFQDSWSHQGVTDSPARLFCDRKLSWGHPSRRGGYLRHDADLTYKYAPDAVRMAQSTYDLLCAYRAVTAGAGCPSFSTIEQDVRSFASASTKSAKASWFRHRSFSDLKFLETINLPDGGDEWDSARDASFAADVLQEPPLSVGATPEEKGFVEFLKDWFTAKDMIAISGKWLGAPRRLPAYVERGVNVHPNLQRFSQQLEAWRVRDHGAVVQALSGRDQPRPMEVYGRYFDYGYVPYNVEARPETKGLGLLLSRARPFTSLEEALMPFEADVRYVVGRQQAGAHAEIVVGAFRPRHSPQLIVVVTGYMDTNDALRIYNIETVIPE